MGPFNKCSWIIGDEAVDCFIDALLNWGQVVAETGMQNPLVHRVDLVIARTGKFKRLALRLSRR